MSVIAEPEMVLTVRQENREDSTWRFVTLSLPRENATIADVWLEFIGEPDLPHPANLDGAVLLMLFFCMVRGGRLIVEGTVSPSLVRSLRYFQRAWVRSRPERYRAFEIVPAALAEAPTAADRAISAFSGGIDSVFLALQHGSSDLGNARYPLTDVMFAHGMDIPTAATETFSKAADRNQELLDSLSLRLRLVRTNIKEQLPFWRDSHGSLLGGLLHQYSHEFAFGLIGSTNSYEHMHITWGSNPTTDPLMSSRSFAIVHDGAEYRRIEKVRKVAENPIARGSVRMCWQGADLSRNCGVCETCTTTHLAFAAVGDPNPPCFDGPLNPEFAKHVQAKRLRYFEYLLEASEGRDEEPWRIALQKRMRVLRAQLAWQSLKDGLAGLVRAASGR